MNVCYKAALEAATGEFVFYQSDDDLIADDYVEKMVALFEGNPDCTSAAGLVKDIDSSGKLLGETRTSNFRPRYMPGHLLALSTLNLASPGIMYSAPGCIFTLKREEFIRRGGYYSPIESSQLYGIVPFGITGFDDTALLYWRRHEGQENKVETSLGLIGFDLTLDLLNDWQIQKRWEVFGKDLARYVASRVLDNAYIAAANWLVVNFYYFRFKACGRILKGMWFRAGFWRHLPSLFWKEKRQFKYSLKPKFRKVFESYPKLVETFPWLMPLKERAFK